MTKEEKLQFIKQSVTMIDQLIDDMQQRLAYAKEGLGDNNINLIMGDYQA